MLNTIFLIFGIVILLIFLLSIVIIHIRSLRDDINTRWYNIADKLQYRQDLLPNLIETIRLFIPKEELIKHEEFINKTIEIRSRAEKNTNPGAKKIVVEHDLSNHVNQLIKIAKQNNDLRRSTNFLELKKELSDIGDEIEKLTSDYNQKVRHHNDVIKRPYNVLPALIMRYKKKTIFEFE